MSMSSGVFALASITVLAGTALTGCSSDDADRNASILSKKTSVCVVNDSPSRVELTFLRADDVSGETILWENMGSKACGRGGGGLEREDVAIGILTTEPNARWIVVAGNMAIGPPGITITQQLNGRLYSCIDDAFGENESTSYDSGFVTFTTTRLPDTSVKNFEVRISGSTDPAEPGETRKCTTRAWS